MSVPTPIADFIDTYARSSAARFHMPGHKGRGGMNEAFDLTEIDGAGDLYADTGIVAESERIAGGLFGCRTFYSAEGSSLTVKAMLAAVTRGGNRRILAARNAHRAFLSAAILLDLDVRWLPPPGDAPYFSAQPTADGVCAALEQNDTPPAAVYITTPDYLGNLADVRGIAQVCEKYGVPLLADNAHGAYLRFLTPSMHPIGLGAAMCADSAHKTLPVITGGAYLHLSESAERRWAKEIKPLLSLFGSSSPSYLILRSLDRCNPYLQTLEKTLSGFLPKIRALKNALAAHGWTLIGDEPLKLALQTKTYGYTGDETARYLTERGAVPEFHDPDFVTLMLSPANTDEELDRLRCALTALPKKAPVPVPYPTFPLPERILSLREAFFAPWETLPVTRAAGRILSEATLSCPPAVPIAVSGERLSEPAIRAMRYYGIDEVRVVSL